MQLYSVIYVSNVCLNCFYWLRQLRQVRRSLDAESVSTLVHAFVTSHVDYCNAVLAGAPRFTQDNYSSNAAARLVTTVAWNVFFMTTCTGSTFPNEFS